MRDILFEYHQVHPTTWAYLSSLLMIGLFFKFNRFWSVRNADLVLLILLAPGLLVVHFGNQHVTAAKDAWEDSQQPPTDEKPPPDGDATVDQPAADGPLAADVATPAPPNPDSQAGSDPGDPPPEALAALSPKKSPELRAVESAERVRLFGFAWLLGVSLLLLIRLLIDPTMVRRPLLEPNLTVGGLTFIGCSMFVFLMANVITGKPTAEDKFGAQQADQLLTGDDSQEPAEPVRKYPRHGPGYGPLSLLPHLATMPLREQGDTKEVAYVRTAKAMAILSHLAIVLGLVAIGYRHFGNLKTGIGAATVYLILPYTALMTARIRHALPAALLTWAICNYRRPLTAGILLGLAAGVIYYPLFVLPLWISFYWQRGLWRFVVGLLCSLAVMVLGEAIRPGDIPFAERLIEMFGIWAPRMSGLQGIWSVWDPIYRMPVIVAFIALSVTFAIWPAQKNLGTLLSCSAALMVAAQCWHGYGGGLFIAWYLPLLLLTVFRPNLEDRVALSVLSEGWFPRRNRVGGKKAA